MQLLFSSIEFNISKFLTSSFKNKIVFPSEDSIFDMEESHIEDPSITFNVISAYKIF
jgi:hypothetical protein